MNSATTATSLGKVSPSQRAASGRRARGSGVAVAYRVMLLGMAWLAVAAGAYAKEAVHPLFQRETALTVTLQAPWADLLRNTKDQRRHAAVLGYIDEQGKEHRFEATVETRGLTRLRVCRFPPLRLRFSKDAAAGSVFAGQDSLKMVTHCRNGQVVNQYYVQEMLAYRIYNLVTSHSFRIRPLDISYQDTQGGKPDVPRFAFLIEDVDDMARRNGFKRDPGARFLPGDFDTLALSRFMLFQYLIGNTDWEVLSGPQQDECCHNVRVVRAGDQGRIPVPYDFDSAGMVAASYAVPHQSLPIKEVSERLYRGFCLHNDTLGAARKEFLGHRQAIFGLIQDEGRLSPQRKRALNHYFEQFYATLGDDALFAKQVSAKCRK